MYTWNFEIAIKCHFMKIMPGTNALEFFWMMYFLFVGTLMKSFPSSRINTRTNIIRCKCDIFTYINTFIECLFLHYKEDDFQKINSFWILTVQKRSSKGFEGFEWLFFTILTVLTINYLWRCTFFVKQLRMLYK